MWRKVQKSRMRYLQEDRVHKICVSKTRNLSWTFLLWTRTKYFLFYFRFTEQEVDCFRFRTWVQTQLQETVSCFNSYICFQVEQRWLPLLIKVGSWTTIRRRLTTHRVERTLSRLNGGQPDVMERESLHKVERPIRHTGEGRDGPRPMVHGRGTLRLSHPTKLRSPTSEN